MRILPKQHALVLFTSIGWFAFCVLLVYWTGALVFGALGLLFICVWVVALVVGLVFQKREICRKLGIYGAGVFVLGFIALNAYLHMLIPLHVRAAQSYLEGVEPVLNDYHSVHGRFPLSIQDIPTVPSGMPYLIRHNQAAPCRPSTHPDELWYCPDVGGQTYTLIFGYTGVHFDKRSTYKRKSGQSYWDCNFFGCIR